MPKYYSEDMRKAALDAVSRGESRKEIIKFFGISLKTLANWIKLKRSGEDLRPNKRGSYKEAKSVRERLLEVISRQPDLTLDELSELLSKHRTTIFYHLKKLGVTRKKNDATRRTR